MSKKDKRKVQDQPVVEQNAGNRWLLYAISIICGSALMGLEILGGRLLSPYFGGSVYVWGSIISVFLLALSVGYYYGGMIADRRPSIQPLLLIVGLSGLLFLVIPPLVGPLTRWAYGVGLANSGALVVSVLLFGLPSLGLGMVSPYVVRLGVQASDNLGNQVGKFYAISTMGSILGTLGTTFLLIPNFGVRQVVIALGVILVILAVALLLIARGWKFGGALALLLLIALPQSAGAEPEVPEYQKSYNFIYRKESMYNDTVVADAGDYRYLIFNDSEQSGMSKSRPNVDVWPYTRVMHQLANEYQKEAKSLLLIGLGGGTLPRTMLNENPQLRMDAIDIDPEVIEVAQRYFGMPKTENLHVEAADGRMYLQGKQGKYDLIMVDAYNRLAIPYHLTTKEFFQELKASLKPGGKVIFNVVSSAEGDYSPFFRAFMKTGLQVFKDARVFMAEGKDPFNINNLEVVFSQGKLGEPGAELADIEYKGRIETADVPLLTDDYAPVENLAAKLMEKTY